MFKRWIYILALLASGSASSASDRSSYHAEPNLAVSHYLPSSFGKDLVVLTGGRDKGVLNGSTINVMRSTSVGVGTADRVWVQTGLVKAIQVGERTTVAQIINQGTEMSSAVFNKHRGVMAGDRAALQNFSITANLSILPESKLYYRNLFLDPKANPQSLEFSFEGRQELLKAVQPFLHARIGKIVVEGHTDHVGPSLMNQVESYQRALTVRQFLINEAGLDPRKVVAIGFGEAEAVDMSLAPGSRDRQRRIVIRTLNQTST